MFKVYPQDPTPPTVRSAFVQRTIPPREVAQQLSYSCQAERESLSKGNSKGCQQTLTGKVCVMSCGQPQVQGGYQSFQNKGSVEEEGRGSQKEKERLLSKE